MKAEIADAVHATLRARGYIPFAEAMQKHPGVIESSLHHWCHKGRVDAVMISGSRWVHAGKLAKWLDGYDERRRFAEQLKKGIRVEQPMSPIEREIAQGIEAKGYLPVRKAAEVVGVNGSTIYSWAARGDVKRERVGRVTWVFVEDVKHQAALLKAKPYPRAPSSSVKNGHNEITIDAIREVVREAISAAFKERGL